MLNFARIAQIRENKGLSQRELAKKSKISYGYVGQLETQENVNPTIRTIVNIANALELEVEDFIKAIKNK